MENEQFPGLRAFDTRHVYDFYKPNPHSEYPTVDGKLSIECYTNALDNCFRLYSKKAEMKIGMYVHMLILYNCAWFLKIILHSGLTPKLDSFVGIVFHAPYCKLVQKSLARLKFLEMLSTKESTTKIEPIDDYLRNYDSKYVILLICLYNIQSYIGS